MSAYTQNKNKGGDYMEDELLEELLKTKDKKEQRKIMNKLNSLGMDDLTIFILKGVKTADYIIENRNKEEVKRLQDKG